jgi:hypothetical protein
MSAPQARGEAADYYNEAPPQQQQYQMDPPRNDQKYAPPQYEQNGQNGQNYGPTGGENGYGEKPTFEQTFKIQGPKYHDIWAGALVWALVLL